MNILKRLLLTVNLIGLILSALPGQIDSNKYFSILKRTIDDKNIIFETEEFCEDQVKKDNTKECVEIWLFEK